VADFVTGAVQPLVALLERLNKLERSVHETVRSRIPSKEFRVQLQLVQYGIYGKEN
jgi:hypothetical protein